MRECIAVWSDPDRARREVELLKEDGWRVRQCFTFCRKTDGKEELAYALVR